MLAQRKMLMRHVSSEKINGKFGQIICQIDAGVLFVKGRIKYSVNRMEALKGKTESIAGYKGYF